LYSRWCFIRLSSCAVYLFEVLRYFILFLKKNMPLQLGLALANDCETIILALSRNKEDEEKCNVFDLSTD